MRSCSTSHNQEGDEAFFHWKWKLSANVFRSLIVPFFVKGRISNLLGALWDKIMVGGSTAKYNVLVDEGGIMLTHGGIEELQAALAAHLAHSPLELEAIGRRTVEERYPDIVSQFNFDCFKVIGPLARHSGTDMIFAIDCKRPPTIPWECPCMRPRP